MAWKVDWTENAWNDLEKIADYIALDSPHYAAGFVSEVNDAAESLRQFAERGRRVPEISDSAIRELLIGNYRLIYQIKNQHVLILTFIHGARDLIRD